MRGGKPAHTFDGVLLATAKQLAFFFFCDVSLELDKRSRPPLFLFLLFLCLLSKAFDDPCSRKRYSDVLLAQRMRSESSHECCHKVVQPCGASLKKKKETTFFFF